MKCLVSRAKLHQGMDSKMTFGHAEKRAKSCAKTLVKALLLFVTVWVLGCVIHFEQYQLKMNSDTIQPTVTSAHTTHNGPPATHHATLSHSDHSSDANRDKTVSKDVKNGRNIKSYINDDSVHVVFSTDCSSFQDWQTLLLFHSATVVHQRGAITRVASGCSAKRERELRALYLALHPSRSFHVHFTPDFKTDARTKKKYDFYNKPYGMLHWLEHAVPPLQPGTVLALVDPDFIFLRPLTARVAGEGWGGAPCSSLVSGGVTAEHLFEKAGRGRPVAQHYGLGAPWTNARNRQLNRTRICGEGSPCLRVPDERAGSTWYSVGPPYLLEKEDFLRLARTWVQLVPKVYEGFPDLLAEMYAYSMAAAHEQLPHLRMDHFMVSNIDMDAGEGWQWVDALGEEVAAPPDQHGVFFPGRPLPTFAHYCQFYRAAKIGFHKRRVHKDVFSCESGLFVDLPKGLALADHKEREGGERIPQTQQQVRRSTFMLSVLHSAFNAALLHFKATMCSGGAQNRSGSSSKSRSSNANFERNINLANEVY